MPVIDSTLIPTTISSSIIAAATEASVVLKLATKQPMPTGAASVPILKTLPTSGWVNGHGGRKPGTTVEWSSDQIVPEEVAATIAVPQSLIDDSGIPLWNSVKAAIVDAVTFSIDSAILFGDNAPPSFLVDGVVGEAVRDGRVPHSPVAPPGQPDLAEAVNQAMGDVENDGLQPTGHAADVSIKSKLRGLRDANGLPIFVPNLGAGSYDTLYALPIAWSGSGAFDTTAVDLITGDWTKLIVGVRQDIRVETSTDGVIADATGKVLVSAFQDDQVLMRVYARLGYVLGKPVTRRSGGPANPFGLVRSTPGVMAAGAGGPGTFGESDDETDETSYRTGGATAGGKTAKSAKA
jgi:HK97 family phage major capsid protein